MIIGIDHATQPGNVGVAVAHFDGEHTTIKHLQSGAGTDYETEIGSHVSGNERALIAIDAPLGWPSSLSRSLSHHRPGAKIDAVSEEFFRRKTDRIVEAEVGIRPLEVAASWIARTAYSALESLAAIRARCTCDLPTILSSKASFSKGVIEVYPAATLRAHQLPHQKYKDNGNREVREKILDGLLSRIELSREVDRETLLTSHHILDAAVCALAAHDFLSGFVRKPNDSEVELARIEGWIWVYQSPSPMNSA